MGHGEGSVVACVASVFFTSKRLGDALLSVPNNEPETFVKLAAELAGVWPHVAVKRVPDVRLRFHCQRPRHGIHY